MRWPKFQPKDARGCLMGDTPHSPWEGSAELEVVELILTLAVHRSDVRELANALLHRFGGLRAVMGATHHELESVEGLDEVAAASLRFACESAASYLQETSEDGKAPRDPQLLRGLRVAVIGRSMFAERDRRTTTMSREEIRRARDEGRA